MGTLFEEVKVRIETFAVSFPWTTEEAFQAELQGYLKVEFPQSKVEIQKGASRPDIEVDDVCIEVKGPTTPTDLITIADKCMRYSPHYKGGMICVLFDVHVARERYDEWKSALQQSFPSVVVIEKPLKAPDAPAIASNGEKDTQYPFNCQQCGRPTMKKGNGNCFFCNKRAKAIRLASGIEKPPVTPTETKVETNTEFLFKCQKCERPMRHKVNGNCMACNMQAKWLREKQEKEK